MDFIFNMTPPVLLIMAISIAMIWFFYHKKLKVSIRDRAKLMEYNENSMIVKPLLLRRSLIVVGLLLVGFVLQGALGLEASTIAMCAAMIMLIINDKKKVEQTLMHGVDGKPYFSLSVCLCWLEDCINRDFWSWLLTRL
jgi:Na+/H+ antiporter NhaD/arsenite permease-like protein